MVDNERTFDGDALPVPDVTPPDLKTAYTAELSECPISPIPFICDWCTDG
jgi:hypothetical protein